MELAPAAGFSIQNVLKNGNSSPFASPVLMARPARRQAVELSLGHRAEIARAEKHADLVVIVGLVDRRVKAETGKAEIYRGSRRRQVAERKQFGLVDDLEAWPFFTSKMSTRFL